MSAAHVLEVDDLQARRLCATENLQRADLVPIEEVMALAELVDASLLLDCGDEYAQIGSIQEPKWRVWMLLMKLDSDDKNGTDYFRNKFVPKVQAIFAGLPKPQEWLAFQKHDLPLLFTPDEVQRFALAHKLNKSQTKAVDTLQKAAPEFFKEIVNTTPERAIERIVELASDPIHPVADAKAKDIEEVRDLSAETIRQAAKNHQTLKRQEASLWIERAVTVRPVEPVTPPVNPVKPGDWWKLGRHRWNRNRWRRDAWRFRFLSHPLKPAGSSSILGIIIEGATPGAEKSLICRFCKFTRACTKVCS